jgi:tetratricopeptide (TPR) repeat protein
MKLQEWAKALEDYQRVLALGAGTPSVHNSRAEALWKLGQVDEAIKSYTTGINLRPDDPVPWKNRGLVYSAAGRTREIADFDQAIRLNPEFAEAWLQRGAIYNEAGGRPANAGNAAAAAWALTSDSPHKPGAYSATVILTIPATSAT